MNMLTIYAIKEFLPFKKVTAVCNVPRYDAQFVFLEGQSKDIRDQSMLILRKRRGEKQQKGPFKSIYYLKKNR